MRDQPEVTPVRKGDIAVLVRERKSFALRPENHTPTETEYQLVKIESATREGFAKKIRKSPHTAAESPRVIYGADVLRTLGKHARHPALLAAFEAGDVTEGVKLGATAADARDAIKRIIEEARV